MESDVIILILETRLAAAASVLAREMAENSQESVPWKDQPFESKKKYMDKAYQKINIEVIRLARNQQSDSGLDSLHSSYSKQ